MALKKKQLGKVVAQVEGYRVRHAPKGDSGFAIYKGKNLFDGGYETAESAVEAIKGAI